MVTEATYSAPGLEQRVCTCGETETRQITQLELTFTDVSATAWYKTELCWALDNKITDGMTVNGVYGFYPSTVCTRAQVVSFLWKAAGQPEPETTANPFTDISEKNWYYKAVLWAVENDITEGMTTTTFGPQGECTRAQVVTFLYRFAGKPEISNRENPFADVEMGKWYSNAVLWAVENGITDGMSKNGVSGFWPGDTCTRAQIVTFLYRYMN